ncbi:hypothetical protein FKK32_29530, partial [Klebsiella pneumoniae]|nr:hypothetical protein [Klebsiella pneumoniae]
TRVVFDPFSDVKLLARDPLRFRRQLLKLREHFSELGATVLLIQEAGIDSTSDTAGEGVVHGIITLYQHAPDYGKQRRRLQVHKMRGVPVREGFHDISIETGSSPHRRDCAQAVQQRPAQYAGALRPSQRARL